MHCIECGKEIDTGGVGANEWHHERGCCSSECLAAWEHYRIGELCRELPLMDKIVEERNLEDALCFATELFNCRLAIDHVNGWRISADTVWQSPDWGWFGSREAGILHTIDGFAITGDENIGFRRAHLSVVGGDLFDTVLAMIAEVRRWRGSCIEACDTWVLDHVAEIDLRASDAVAHNCVTIDALDELREWIQVLQWSAGWERPWV